MSRTTPRFARFTKDEKLAVNTIVARAVQMHGQVEVGSDMLAIEMSLAAVHATCPLDLQKLSEADAFTFAHDMNGIAAHLNRRTGELEDCFRPRCTKKTEPNPDCHDCRGTGYWTGGVDFEHAGGPCHCTRGGRVS